MRSKTLFVLSVLATAPSMALAQGYVGPYPNVPPYYGPLKASTAYGDWGLAWAAMAQATGNGLHMMALAEERHEHARALAIDNLEHERAIKRAKFDNQRADEAAARARRAEKRLSERAQRDREVLKLIPMVQSSGGVNWPHGLQDMQLLRVARTIDERLVNWIVLGEPLSTVQRQKILSSVGYLKSAVKNANLDNADRHEVVDLVYKIERLVNLASDGDLRVARS